MISSNSPLKLALFMVVVAVACATQLSGKISGTRGISGTVVARHQGAVPEAYGRQRLSSGGRVILDADRQGHFHADVEIEGRVVTMIVDTGATAVSLSSDDAASMGIRPAPHEYTLRMRTANGIAAAALVRLHEIRVGGIVVRDIAAVVAPPGQSTPSLLGMTFLRNLRHFEISDQRLVLEQ